MCSHQEDCDCDFEDSLLRELTRASLPMRSPVIGERLGGADGRRFEIVSSLGGGAMGLVFRARDEELQRTVALKFLQPLEDITGASPMERLRQEARAIAQFDHENIVSIFDASEWTGEPWETRVPFLVMECLEGESLGALLQREGRLDVRRALTILCAVAAGLTHAHERHIVHRDLKPSNVYLSRKGHVKLLDFGLAWLTQKDSPSIPLLPTAGTPPYMAPEQWKGEPQDERTDIWSAGVMMYEMLTGQHPFPGDTLEELRASITADTFVPSMRVLRPELPEALDALLGQMLVRDPARRLASAAELHQQLRRIEESLSPWREEPRGLEPGRRQVTLVGCWLAGLAELARELDPEDFGEVQAAFHRTCSQVVREYGGSITYYVGDEVLACFGHPQTKEDDSVCAAHAALKIATVMRRALCERLPPACLPGLAARVGIHTDTVVFDDIPPELHGGTPAIQGEGPRIALWLAHQAKAGTVNLSGTTATLIHGSFQTQPVGMRAFEGLGGRREVEVRCLLRARRRVSRFDRAHGLGTLTPLVGREEQLHELLDIWERVRGGQGAFVLICGEAGIGKSRLIQELRRRVPPASGLKLQCQCWSQFSHSAFRPIIEMLQHLLRLSPSREPRRNLIRLRKQLEMAGLSAEKVGLIASFLSLPVDEASLHLKLSRQRQKEMTFEALTDLLLCMAAQRPVLAIIEDLHWADPSTLELLSYLLERVEPARIGVVISTRPDFQPAWGTRKTLHKVVLERLPAAMTAALVRETPGGRALPPETVEQLVEKTDGVPLFVEELTRMVLARAPAGASSHGPPAMTIPVTLNELLLTRLDMLSPRQKALAQLCAVVGRSFPLALLVMLTGSKEEALLRDLRDLGDAGLLQHMEEAREPAYQFRHALLQEAAYQSLLRKTRRRYHGRIAQALASQFPAIAEGQPELLAHHFTEAGQVEQAIGYWARAGELASRRSANLEAVSHLTQALTLLRGLPDASERLQDELKLLLALGIPQMQLEGCSYQVEQNYARAWELILALGDALPRLDLSYWGLFSYYFARAQFEQSHRLSEHLVRLGERQEHREMMALGLRMMAVGLFTVGKVPAAAEHIERALACSEGLTLERHRAIAVKQWINPRAAALAYGSVVYSALGELEKAWHYDAESVRMAGEIGHPNTTGFVLTYTAVASQLRREPRRALEKANRCIALSREHQMLFWLAWSMFIRAWALSELGSPKEGLALFQATMEKWRASGMRAGMPIFQGMLAEILLKLERPQEALAAVVEGLGWVDTTGEASYAVELDRTEGECLWALGREAESVRSFFRALQRARQQGARAYALHVETDLARHLRELGHEEQPQHPL